MLVILCCMLLRYLYLIVTSIKFKDKELFLSKHLIRKIDERFWYQVNKNFDDNILTQSYYIEKSV